MERDNRDQDCAICLQKYHHPAELPCGHVFCFLCVKGIARTSKKCAICRTNIPADYFDHPVLLDNPDTDEILEPENEKYHWYYEGRNGWWKYDERSNVDLESAFNSNEAQCLLLLAGTLYVVDLQNNIQIRRNDPTKRRRIKRDLTTLPSKGIAGIKILDTTQTDDTENNSDVNINNTENAEHGNEENVSDINTNNTVNAEHANEQNTSDVNINNTENAEHGNGVILLANVSITSGQGVSTTGQTVNDLADRLSNINLQIEDTTNYEEPVLQDRDNV
ncbi:E3 ubiquitin-protein ligase RNF146 [Bicyclus anynana]|uniref:E3 ubiquitin-protein ligase n=1 Tax=Bicyclus anynana TaxID=110368 RepID=A0A6J1NMD3_BICAN|nr:E3 ubiquitin-protein ligase RNF146 [Bicyclus anynana]